MNRRIHVLAATAVLALAGLAGCGGGGSSQPALPVPGSTGGGGLGSQGVTRVRGTVTIPAPSKLAAARRFVKYVSPNTNSLVYKQGTFNTVVPLAAGASGCTANSDGSRTCSFTASAVPGTAVPFTVSTYQSNDASGNPLSIATMTESIVAGQANTLNLTLDPVVATIGVAITGTTFTTGTAGSQTVTVTAKDGSGATIATGVANLVDITGAPAPVTLVDGDSSGATSFAASGTPVTSLQLTTSTTATLYYNGTGAPNNEVVTATSGNAANAKLATASATLLFQGTSLYVLDNAGGRIIEYILAGDGSIAANATPRRIIMLSQGGVPVNSMCPGLPISPAGTLFVDSNGNIIVSLSCTSASSPLEYYLVYGPNSEGAQQPTAPLVTFTGPLAGLAGAQEVLAFDPNASSNGNDTFYTANGAQNFNDPSMFYTVTYQPPASTGTATLSQIGGSPGMPPATASSSFQTAFFPNAVLATSGNVLTPFATVVTTPANPSVAATPAPDALYRTALPLSASTMGSIEAPTAAIIGDATQFGYQISGSVQVSDGMAVANGFLYVLLDASGSGPVNADASGAPGLANCTTMFSQPYNFKTCADMDLHSTLLAYDMNSILSATGTSSVAPAFAISGAPAGSTATAGLGCSGRVYSFNNVAAYKTKVYVANQDGSNCNNSTATAPFNSEVDIFETSGLNGPTNSVVPVALKNGNVFPTAIAIGPSGTATSPVTTLSVARQMVRWPNLRPAPNVSRRRLRSSYRSL